MGNTMELACEATVKKVDLTAKVEKSQVIRKMRIKLEREFDVLMARAIGGDAQKILDTLKSRSAEKVVMAIDGILARLELNVAAIGSGNKTDSIIIPRAVGGKATASAASLDSDEDGLKPTIVLEFEFAFAENAWAWFGRNTGGFATIEISPAQLKLAKAS